MSSVANWSQGPQQSPPSRKRGREGDERGDQSSPYSHQNRRFRSDYPQGRSPRNRRGGHDGGHHDQQRSSNHHLTESFLQSVWGLGDSERFDFRHEIPDLVQRIEAHFLKLPNDVLKAFRIAVAELPHKLPHYALLISLLSVTPHGYKLSTSESDPNPPSIGLQIIRDLSRSFQLHIDNRRWRSTRLFLQLFGHLHALSKPLVSSHSLLSLLRAIFNATTDELTCTGARADECLRMVCEGLMRSGLLKSEDSEINKDVAEFLESIRVHMVVNRRFDRSLFNEPDSLSQYIDPVEELVASLDGIPIIDVLPVLDEPFGPLLEVRMRASGLESPYPTPFDLPTVLLPPDVEEPGIEPPHSAPEPTTSDEGPGPVPLDSKDRTGYLGMKVSYKLFSDNTVPHRAIANGVVLRTLINDVIDIFEVNRKECAKILLELPRWVGRGTFRTKSAAKPKPGGENAAPENPPAQSSEWVLEHLVLESILSSVFAMPSSPIRSIIYYHSLVVELCRLSPSTVAPGLGKCVRALYGGLGQTSLEPSITRLEPEGIRRFADWFAVHLSNFGFLWAWKDWVNVTALPVSHPQRVFVARVLELEIRLSYFDRIKGTVPISFLESGMIPEDAPGPCFEFENTEHRDHLAALDVIQLLKRKEGVPRLVDYLEKMKERLSGDGIEEPVEDVVREVAVQALLNVGSRSFSHFLNVLERYLELLKSLTTSTDARSSLLKTVSKFWRKNAQFELIVMDKLLEYRVVDPIDSLHHSFQARKGESWGEIQFWDGVKLTVEKVTRRVSASRMKLDRLRKAEEDQRDIERAAGGQLVEQGNGVTTSTDITMKESASAGNEKNEDDRAEKKAGEDQQTNENVDAEAKQHRIKAKQEEIQNAETELQANIAEQGVVLAEACKMFSIAGEESSIKVEMQNGNEEDSVAKGDGHELSSATWKTWWLRGWCREFCRSFAVEISEHYEQITELLSRDDEAGQQTIGHEKMKAQLRITKDWVEIVGFQSV